MKEGFRKDGVLFLNYAFGNMAIWRLQATREALRDLCFADRSHSDAPFGTIAYPSTRAALQKEHPEWFVEEDTEIETGSHDHVENVGPNLEEISRSIGELRSQISQMRITLWVLILIGGYLLLRSLL